MCQMDQRATSTWLFGQHRRVTVFCHLIHLIEMGSEHLKDSTVNQSMENELDDGGMREREKRK